jgi:hypothetical protein
MYIKMMESAGVEWSSLFAPFSADIWMAVAVSVPSISISLSVADAVWRHYSNGNEPQTTLMQAVLHSLGVSFSQGYPGLYFGLFS